MDFQEVELRVRKKEDGGGGGGEWTEYIWLRIEISSVLL
jgi:hypothetical protein